MWQLKYSVHPGLIKHGWLVVSTHLKNISQNGNLPQIGMKIKNNWNHHLELQSASWLSIYIPPKLTWHVAPENWMNALSSSKKDSVHGKCHANSFMGGCRSTMRPEGSHLKIIMDQFLLLVEEVLHHLGCTKPCKSRDKILNNCLAALDRHQQYHHPHVMKWLSYAPTIDRWYRCSQPGTAITCNFQMSWQGKFHNAHALSEVSLAFGTSHCHLQIVSKAFRIHLQTSNLQKSSQKFISSYRIPIFKKTSPTKSLLLALSSWDLLIWQIHLSKSTTWIQMNTWVGWLIYISCGDLEMFRWCLIIQRLKKHTHSHQTFR